MDYFGEMQVLQERLSDLARQNNEQSLDLIQLTSKVSALASGGASGGGLNAADVFIGSYSNTKTMYTYSQSYHPITLPTTHTFAVGEKLLLIGRATFYLSAETTINTPYTAYGYVYMPSITAAGATSIPLSAQFPTFDSSVNTPAFYINVPIINTYTVTANDGFAGTSNIPLTAFVRAYTTSTVTGLTVSRWYYTATVAGIVLK